MGSQANNAYWYADIASCCKTSICTHPEEIDRVRTSGQYVERLPISRLSEWRDTDFEYKVFFYCLVLWVECQASKNVVKCNEMSSENKRKEEGVFHD